MRNYIISSAVLAAALACSPLAIAATTQTTPTMAAKTSTADGHWAHRHHRAMHRRHRAHHQWMPLRKLDLTDAQHATIHQWIKQDFAKSRSARQTLREQRKALAKATPGTVAYQNATKTLASGAANAASARVQQQATLRANIYKLLTPAQRSKLADIQAQRKARMEKWRKAHAHKHHAMPASTASATTH